MNSFQSHHSLEMTGVVDDKTWKLLTSPMQRALFYPRTVYTNERSRFSQMIVKIALSHLAENPRVIGGENVGPWVRLYTKGKEGGTWGTSAISFILQAAGNLQVSSPIPYLQSCDLIAGKAREFGLLFSLPDRKGKNQKEEKAKIHSGDLFLVRKSEGTWSSVGIILQVGRDSFEAVEGNSVELCKTVRSLEKKDFVLLSALDQVSG